MITREFNLYLHAGHSIPLVINVNQYDQGEQWLFTLFNADGTQYVPSSGAIVGIKSDNLGIINSGTVDSQGRVVINETQQMTAAVGKAVFELLIDDQTHGTANFVVLVEPKPGDNADLSESDYSLFQQAIDGTSAAAIAEGVADWMDENLTPTSPVVDASLTVQGAAADSAKVGQELSDLKSQIAQSTGMSAEFKAALENLVSHVAFIGDDPTGQTYIDALHTAMYPPANLTRIGAVYTQSSTVYDTDTLDSLKDGLVVIAYYDNETTEIVSTYALSGTLTEGTSVITVTYGGKTATFNVTVNHDSLLYDWDFTTSLIDKKQGAEFVLGENVERTINGIYYNSYQDGVSKCTTAHIPQGGSAVIEFGSMVSTNRNSANGKNATVLQAPLLFGYRGASDKWSTWYGTGWHDDEVVSKAELGVNGLSEKTLIINFDSNGQFNFSVDGNTILQTVSYTPTGTEYFGFAHTNTNKQTYQNMYIKSLKIYGDPYVV